MYWIKNISSLQIDQQYTDIVEIFKSQINQESTILLALSGGVDSTILFHLLLWCIQEWMIEKEQLMILHMNHKSRKESDQEEKILRKYCKQMWVVFVASSYLGKKKTETMRRKARIQFFESIICLCNQWVIFMTGHHLDDRIETSILNQERGAWLRGRLNMSLQKEKLIRGNWRALLQYVHMRPLISWSKNVILDFTQKHQIWFLEDNSNQDETYTRRNKIRKDLLLSDNQKWINKRMQLYEKHDKNIPCWVEITPLHSPRKDITEYYNVSSIQTIEWVQFLLDYLWIYQNISSWLLSELHTFFAKDSWYKYFKGRYFFRSHGETYCIKSTEKFREDTSQPLLSFSSAIKWKLRRNKSWDTRRNKRYKKFLINQKIPVFLRNLMPVVEEEGRVVGTLYKKDLVQQWYL